MHTSLLSCYAAILRTLAHDFSERLRRYRTNMQTAGRLLLGVRSRAIATWQVVITALRPLLTTEVCK